MKEFKALPTIRKKNVPKKGDLVAMTKSGRVKRISCDEGDLVGIYLGDGEIIFEGIAVVKDEDE
jgi:hypothetical protein